MNKTRQDRIEEAQDKVWLYTEILEEAVEGQFSEEELMEYAISLEGWQNQLRILRGMEAAGL